VVFLGLETVLSTYPNLRVVFPFSKTKPPFWGCFVDFFDLQLIDIDSSIDKDY
jgi:hypothetical protein